MELLDIEGGQKIEGVVKIAGAKNAALPIMMATILSNSEITLQNIPLLRDVKSVKDILLEIGFKIENIIEDIAAGTEQVKLTPPVRFNYSISTGIAAALRASIWVLGPMLSRCGKAVIALPGGCKLGDRKINLHVDALKKMGAEICIHNGQIIATAKSQLNAINYTFPIISVGATINIIMASVLARGTTCLTNCAIEPEIIDLMNFLVKLGANISGIGTRTLIIQGVKELRNLSSYHIIGDRIEAGTFMVAAAITQGHILIKNINPQHLLTPIKILSQIGLEITTGRDSIKVESTAKLKPIDIYTQAFPGFPTDLQAQFSALMCVLQGRSCIIENIFENRYLHLKEFQKMGAKISILSQQKFIIDGVASLSGRKLYASDLRASASLILVALVATGKSQIYNLHYLDRGYASIEYKLLSLGAKVQRIKSVQPDYVFNKAS